MVYSRRTAAGSDIWLEGFGESEAACLYRSQPGAKIDFAPSPDERRLLVIEWQDPLGGARYSSKLSMLDLRTRKVRVLIEPKHFPSCPFWLDDHTVGVLLDGVQAAAVSVNDNSRIAYGAPSGSPLSAGLFRGPEPARLLEYLARMSRKRELAGLVKLAHDTDPVLGLERYHVLGFQVIGITPKRTSMGYESGHQQLLHSFGLLQYPSRWQIGDHHRGTLAYRRELELKRSPRGRLAASAGWTEPSEGWASDFEFSVLDLKTRRKTVRLPIGNNDAIDIQWSADERFVVFRMMDSWAGSPEGLWVVRVSDGSRGFIVEGEKGYLLRGKERGPGSGTN